MRELSAGATGAGRLLPIRAAEEMRATRFGSTFFCRTKPISRKLFIFIVSSGIFGGSNGPVRGLRKKPRRGAVPGARNSVVNDPAGCPAERGLGGGGGTFSTPWRARRRGGGLGTGFPPLQP